MDVDLDTGFKFIRKQLDKQMKIRQDDTTFFLSIMPQLDDLH